MQQIEEGPKALPEGSGFGVEHEHRGGCGGRDGGSVTGVGARGEVVNVRAKDIKVPSPVAQPEKKSPAPVGFQGHGYAHNNSAQVKLLHDSTSNLVACTFQLRMSHHFSKKNPLIFFTLLILDTVFFRRVLHFSPLMCRLTCALYVKESNSTHQLWSCLRGVHRFHPSSIR